MNRRNFLKTFGVAGATTMILPIGPSILKKYISSPETQNDHMVKTYGLRIGDTIIFPHKDGFDKFGIYYVNSIEQVAEVIVIDSVFLDKPNLAPVKGDVFLHITSSPSIATDFNGHAHYEEWYTHELYEITEMVQQNHSTGKYSFNFKPCDINES